VPTINFTVKGLAALLRKPHRERVDYFDRSVPGLGLRIGPRRATWFYMRRIDGRQERLKIGRNESLDRTGRSATPAKAAFTIARERVADIEDTIAQGRHPRTEAARENAAKKESRILDQGRIVTTIAGRWATHHFPSLSERTQRDYQRGLDAFVRQFGDEDLGSIPRRALVRHLDTVAAGSLAEGNRQATVIRRLYAFAEDRYDLDANPAATIRNPGKQTIRDRTLNRAEIRVLWRAAELAGYPYGHCIQLALCTGQRAGEVGSLQRDEIDSDGLYWIQRAARNKSRKRIDLYLGNLARAVLSECPDFGPRKPFFVTSHDADNHPRAPRSDVWNKALARHIFPRIPEAASELGLPVIHEPWTMHDLRRTVRTALTGWCGVNPDTAERVLNHAIGDRLRKAYDHSDYKPHVTDALRRWDRELTSILRGEQAVVRPLRRQRA